jgi:pyruvate dehydrogenase E2 component (dihydrolipoyllysine-residue acetyltransferase)
MGDFRMPSLGADMEEGIFLEWLVKPGDSVHRGDIIAVVETPKSAVEVECFEDGTVAELVAHEGDVVPVGGVLARMNGHAEAPAVAAPASPLVRHRAHELGVDLATVHGTGRRGAITRADVERAATALATAAAPPTPAPPSPAPAPAPPAPPAPARPSPARAREPEGVGRQHISPYARRLARELGVDLHGIPGTGAGGAVRAEDVRRAAAAAVAPPLQPAPQPAPPAPEVPAPAARRADAESMRQSIAALMTTSNREIPHYYLSTTVDLQAATTWLRQLNRELPVEGRVVPSALLLLAAARSARAVPELNGHWVDGGFRPATSVDLGLILSLRRGGLLVPVIRGADALSLGETMAAMRELTKRARAGRLRGSELVTPSITVSNLGDQGVESVLGVIYPPQVALVGFGTVSERPWAVDGMLGVRPLVTVTLAGDHRASDGAVGARFLKHLSRLLQTPEEL